MRCVQLIFSCDEFEWKLSDHLRIRPKETQLMQITISHVKEMITVHKVKVTNSHLGFISL